MSPESAQALVPMTSLQYALEQRFGAGVSLSLVAVDVDRVKEYVFESARLHEVRGASAQLTHLNEHDLPQIARLDFGLPEEALLYVGGGSALLVAPSARAADLAAAIEWCYLDLTGVATVTVVHQPVHPEVWQRGLPPEQRGFGELVAWLGLRLRLAKESPKLVPFFPIPAFVRPCDSCQRRPASERVPDPDGAARPTCAVCRRKADAGRDQKSTYVEDLERYLRADGEGTPYAAALAGIPSLPQPAPSLDEIGQASLGRAEGYVGMIYADGNGVGRWLEGCDAPEEYGRRSARLRQATRAAVFGALAQWRLPLRIRCADSVTRWLHPLEIVAIGGDDLFLVVPGDVALDLAVAICERFDAVFAGELTLSAGVCVVPQRYPIYYGRELCEALLRSAKAAGRPAKGGGTTPSMVDFQIVTGAGGPVGDLEEFRRRAYERTGARSSATGRPRFDERLTERPYPVARLRSLLDLARWLRAESRPVSQLFHLRRQIAEGGWVRSGNWYRYQLARAAGLQDLYPELDRRLAASLELTRDYAPWRFAGDRFTTPIPDLVEILDFVRLTTGTGAADATHDRVVG